MFPSPRDECLFQKDLVKGGVEKRGCATEFSLDCLNGNKARHFMFHTSSHIAADSCSNLLKVDASTKIHLSQMSYYLKKTINHLN